MSNARRPQPRRRLQLTPAFASAAGMDAGNASMRHAGRKHWNRDDYNVAARETNRLFDIIEGVTR